MQNQYDTSFTRPNGAGKLTANPRNGSQIPPSTTAGQPVALFDENDGDFFDCLKPFDYEAYLRREGYAL